MRQYNSIKAKYPDAMLLFRIGDFYETFGQDAIKMAGILNITLTKRGNGCESETALAGFPHHALDNYLPKLVQMGLRVAICDQLEDPKFAKGIVKRGVTELVTPGVTLDGTILDKTSHNFLAALHFGKKTMGVAFLDISTGVFWIASGDENYIEQLLQSVQPKEILVQKTLRKTFAKHYPTSQNQAYYLDDWVFTEAVALDKIKQHFQVNSLKGFGIDENDLGVVSAGAIFHYLSETQHDKLNHITKIEKITPNDSVWMDAFTLRNLELYQPQQPDSVTLFQVINHTLSPMGARQLKQWIVFPLKEIDAIEHRQEIVKYLYAENTFFERVKKWMKEVVDMERLCANIATGRAQPRALVNLKNSLKIIKPIAEIMQKSAVVSVKKMGTSFKNCDTIITKIETTLNEEAPVHINKGGYIARGVDENLDSLLALVDSSKNYLDDLLQREIKATGISSLKIAFNNVFGYYLEVRNTFKNRVPSDWIRKQTLVSGERYITEELKTYEEKILSAEEKIAVLERGIYNDLLAFVTDFIKPIQENARILARLDCLCSFATLAKKGGYVCPEMNEGLDLEIKNGRHPVIEAGFPANVPYIPNDITLTPEVQQIIMITGPNMSGKSAILRQTALIVLLAQIGCFVPATAAKIGVVDKIFTRVGASDNISMGESTFMVEMNETASILNNISKRSLVLLDEIGRGTSTYDGISIAWSIAEFLHNHPTKPKTLFATHYHELNQMSAQYPHIENYNVSVKEQANNILFLRKLVRGGSQHSFGIHVARLAGMPKYVVEQAVAKLKTLEKKSGETIVQKTSDTPPTQLSFFQLEDPVLQTVKEKILAVEIEHLTPLQALTLLNEIKKELLKK